MSRRVGSPKALVMAATVAEKSASLRGITSTPRILPIEIVKIPRPASRRQSMPITESQVFAALAPVNEPVLRRPMTELGLVSRVRIDGGRVEVLATLLEEDEVGTAELVSEIQRVVGAIEGVTAV